MTNARQSEAAPDGGTAGLRFSKECRLCVAHIESRRMALHVQDGYGSIAADIAALNNEAVALAVSKKQVIRAHFRHRPNPSGA